MTSDVGSARLWPAVLAVVLATMSIAPAPAAAAAGAQPPKLLGVATQDWAANFDAYAAATGRYPAFRQVFWTLEQAWPNTWAQKDLQDLSDVGSIAYAEITTSDLAGLLSGAKDNTLAALVADVGGWLRADPDHRLVVAPLPEPNLAEHPWGGDPAGFIAGYRKIRSAFRDAGFGPDRVRFVFATSGWSSVGLSHDDFYPGDADVDIIGFSSINRNKPWLDYDATFQQHIAKLQARIGRTKPMLITQTASVEETGDRDAWLRDMFRNLAANDQVIGALYFNRAKSEAGKFNDYRVIVDGKVDPVFRDESMQWSPPGDAEWLFDGRMDKWVAAREAVYANTPYFGDIYESPFEQDILWLATVGITLGCNPPDNDRFCPDLAVKRGEMAAFLVRALDLPPSSGRDSFGDDDSSVFEGDIERLAASGITQGCNPPVNDRFCPTYKVRRGEMAAFLARGLGLSAGAGSDFFKDDNGSVFESDIERLRAAGITSGCNPPISDRYCPRDFVTRGEMAAFLRRALTSQ